MKHVVVAMCAIVLGAWPVFADCPATLAEQWVVNPSNSEANGQPAVLATYDTEDSYVITWARMLFGSPDTREILARKYDTATHALETSVTVNSTQCTGTCGWDYWYGMYNPSVASAPAAFSGRWFFSWYFQPGAAPNDDFNSIGRRFSSALVALAPDFIVNYVTTGYQYSTSTSAFPGVNKFVSSWIYNDFSPFLFTVGARIFGGSGAPVTNDIALTTVASERVRERSLSTSAYWASSAPNNRFVAAWVGYENPAPPYTYYSKIKFRIVDDNGNAVTAQDVIVDQFTCQGTLNQGCGFTTAWVAADSNGFVVVYALVDPVGGTTSAVIKARTYNVDGTPYGAAFTVADLGSADAAYEQPWPFVTLASWGCPGFLPSPYFLVTWRDYSLRASAFYPEGKLYKYLTNPIDVTGDVTLGASFLLGYDSEDGPVEADLTNDCSSDLRALLTWPARTSSYTFTGVKRKVHTFASLCGGGTSAPMSAFSATDAVETLESVDVFGEPAPTDYTFAPLMDFVDPTAPEAVYAPTEIVPGNLPDIEEDGAW
jgi:hypothetical protein